MRQDSSSSDRMKLQLTGNYFFYQQQMLFPAVTLQMWRTRLKDIKVIWNKRQNGKEREKKLCFITYRCFLSVKKELCVSSFNYNFGFQPCHVLERPRARQRTSHRPHYFITPVPSPHRAQIQFSSIQLYLYSVYYNSNCLQVLYRDPDHDLQANIIN